MQGPVKHFLPRPKDSDLADPGVLWESTPGSDCAALAPQRMSVNKRIGWMVGLLS